MSDGAERANTSDLHVIYHRQPTNMTSRVNTCTFPSLDTSENTFFFLLCCVVLYGGDISENTWSVDELGCEMLLMRTGPKGT